MTASAPACECRHIETTFGTTEPPAASTCSPEVERKLAALRDLLARRGVPAVALRGVDSVAWVTGGLTNRIESGSPASVAWVVVTPDAADVVTTNVELPRHGAEAALDGFGLHGVDWFEPDGFVRAAEELAGVPAGEIAGLGPDVDDDLVELRLSLSAEERARLEALALDASAALEGALREWRPGERDLEIQARVAAGLERVGAFGACLFVGGDERVERFRHPLPVGAAVRRLAMAVVVAERHGLHVALTRFASAGPLPGPVRDARATAAEVESAVLSASRAGATYGEATAALAAAYAAAGHPGAWRDHYQGGPVGYRQREFEPVPGDTASRWHATAILPGTAIAWNPSVAGGGKCEDTYLVEERGLRRLTGTGAWPVVAGRPAVLDVDGGGAA